MMAVDQGLYSVLNTDVGTAMGTVTGSLNNLGATGVYRIYAPQAATTPFILFNEQSGVDTWTFADRERKSLLYQVKAVGAGHSGSAVAAMNDRLDTLLNDQPLTLTGWTCKRIRRESDIEYGEEANGVIYHHVGGLFRIDVEPT